MNKSKKDAKVQIPAQAWITSFVVMNMDDTLKNDPDISLKKYIDGQKEKTNIWQENTTFPIYNVGYLLMMAYAFLVIPKESIEQYGLKVTSQQIGDLLDKMTINTNTKLDRLDKNENIIRHIRNSISHAHFNWIPENEELLFNDVYKGKVTFHGTMRINDFKSLIVEYYKKYHEEYMKSV